MSAPADPAALLARIEEARALLDDHDHQKALTPRLADPLPSLIQQCRTLAEEASEAEAEPVRCLHHFACTGGTLMARYLAVQPNTVLLSEIDPLSLHHIDGSPPRFAPTDLIRHLRYSPRGISEQVIGDVFLAALEPLLSDCRSRGRRLILRDHAHSQFCHKDAPYERPTLRGLLMRRYPVRSVVTVRHPLDAYLSLANNDWLHFTPDTLDEYARRHLAFLDAHEGVGIVRYEDFLAAPEPHLRHICDLLDVPFAGVQPELVALMPLTGDSGRGGHGLRSRPRRPVPQDVAEAARSSQRYIALCDRLGYDPAPDAAPVPQP
ncbi:hypothetical protein AB9K34_21755 [Sedimentitalea sp. XS_ASV28]|uniref:hypothetical protein n=1 Tax=Sedimentitalea sp. XS_ASV28 TaxID=3241296 RepID=UPI003511D280